MRLSRNTTPPKYRTPDQLARTLVDRNLVGALRTQEGLGGLRLDGRADRGGVWGRRKNRGPETKIVAGMINVFCGLENEICDMC